jgi:nitrite reductase/ring-hydroxylating ferredoxin subunit
MATTDEPVPVADRAELKAEGRAVVAVGGESIALFSHEGEVYAVDNRCPHMGFPLSEGTVDEGVLTCHWHHARFELGEGDTFDVWADDVRTFPTEIRDGQVYVDPDPERRRPPATRWRDRLVDGLQENLSLVMAKAVLGLDEAGEGFGTPLSTALDFGTRYRDAGWGRGLTTLGCVANVHEAVGARDRRRAMFTGVRTVAEDCADEPPRFQGYAFDTREVSADRLRSWFRENCEVRDEDGAERVLLTALATLDRETVAELLFTAATDHRYMDAGHTLDFVQTALGTLDHAGWDDHAEATLASLVPRLTGATRAEETAAWRQPVDVAGLCADAEDRLPELVAAGEGRTWNRPAGFVERLLGDDPEAILDSLTEAIREGATVAELADAVARAATRRVAYFDTGNEFSDWNTAHHTLSYADAVYRAAERTDATALYRGCFDAATSVYLDRFLNSPRAPVPEPGASDRTDPATIQEELLACLDEQGTVDRAARLTNAHFDAGGDPAALKRTLGRGLLREDTDFHTVQEVDVGFARFDAVDTAGGGPAHEFDRRLALVAPARYLAAHTPTRREAEQTFSIATRLHRGDRLHEAE